MTLTLELPEEVEQVLGERARARGVSLPKYLQELAERDAQAEAPAPQVLAEAQAAPEPWPALDELVSFATSLPNHRAAAGLEPLDLSGPRADVYSYTEREDAQL